MMRKLYFLMFTCALMWVIPRNARGQQPFIGIWNTYAYSTPNFQIFIPACGDFTYEWEEVSNPSVSGSGSSSGHTTIALPAHNVDYRVKIYPDASNGNPFHCISYRSDYEHAAKFREIEQWGDIVWSSFDGFAYAAKQLVITATDQPNLTNVTDMSSAFYGCEAIETIPGLGSWNVSNVENMEGLFESASFFDQDISTWNVGNVTNMSSMFRAAFRFNQDLSAWDVRNVQDMSQMFAYCDVFNQNLNSWEVDNVIDMSYMFSRCEQFNQPLANWNVGKVESMVAMFEGARAFNQPLNSWDVSNVEEMAHLFLNCDDFNQPLDNWNVSKVKDMNHLFGYAFQFDQSLETWNLQSLESNFSFEGSGISCENFSKTLQGWANNPNTASNIHISYISYSSEQPTMDAYEYLLNVKNWTFSQNYPGGCFIEPLQGTFTTVWKTDFPGREDSEIRFEQEGECVFRWEEVGNPSNTGSGGSGYVLTTITLPHPGVYRLEIMPLDDGGTPFQRFKPANGDEFKLIDVEQWGDTEWSTFDWMFAKTENLFSISATDLPDLSLVESMEGTFYESAIQTVANIGDWDVSNVISMEGMFESAIHFNEDISTWNTKNVENMNFLFYGTSFNQNVGLWDVRNVQSMASMFAEAVDFNQPLDSWNVGNVTSMTAMFADAVSFNQPLKSWNVSNVEEMNFLFAGATSFNQPLGAWDVRQVRTMEDIFVDASSFNQDLGAWQLESLDNSWSWENDLSFENSGMSCEHYSQTLWGWAQNTNTVADVRLAAANMEYSLDQDVQDARNHLATTLAWTVSGDAEGVCTNVPLSVTLLEFVAEKSQHRSILRWLVSEKHDAIAFYVERSADGKNWDELSIVSAAAHKASYVAYDEHPLQNMNFYRLKLVDKDDMITYSPMRMLRFNTEAAIQIYPNPARETIQISGPVENSKIEIIDIFGRVVMSGSIDNSRVVSINAIPAGAYQLKIIDEHKQLTTKQFIKN